jgi:hypothetical protein
MNYQIDQSGKVEYTSHDTVVAFSNGQKAAILLKAKEKRILQQIFREAGKAHIFPYRVFAILIFLLLKRRKFQELIIDTEYPGKSDLIKNYLLSDFRKAGIKISPSDIHFQQIGKKCEAHWHGYYVFTKKRKAEKIVSAKDIMKEVFK